MVLTVLQSSHNSAAKDTCEAMDQWAQHPQAETALSNILPCVDESTTNRTLYQSKEVVVMLVRIVNRLYLLFQTEDHIIIIMGN